MLTNLLFVNPPPDHPEFIEGMEKAAAILDAAIYDPITVNILVGYGGAFGDLTSQGSAIGGPFAGIPVPYPALYATLWLNDTNSVKGLPLATTLDGREFFSVSTAQAKAFGWISGSLPIPDGHVDMGKDWTGTGLIDAAVHELTHAMGRIDAYGPLLSSLDLFRYDETNGSHVFDTGKPATPLDRTLLTTGLVAAGMQSLAAGQKRIETPHLAVRYTVPRESTFWQT